MSATEELRRMLDERGVEWKAPNSCLRDEMTMWTAGGFDYEAFEVPEPDGTFLLTAAHKDDLTPEQAIEATLGGQISDMSEKSSDCVRDGGEMSEVYTREDVESAFVRGYSLGTLPVGSDPQWDENRQTVDEHMAELGWVRAAEAWNTRAATTIGQVAVEVVPKVRTCKLEPLEAFYVTANMLDQTEWGVCSNCGTASPIDATYCCECGRKVER